ncbi:MAG: amidohydrolase [Clostridia bacterium]
MTKKILIKNAKAIVTCNQLDQVFYDTDLLIEDREIVAIGKNLAALGAEIIDGRDKFIYPGLVNTHHHFFQTFVRNLMKVDYPNISVIDWLDVVYGIFQNVTEDVMYYSSLTAMADLIKHGCTCAFDHQYCYPRKAGKELIDRQMEAAALLGIRYHGGRGANNLPMSAGSPIPDEMLETTAEFIADCERLILKYHDAKPFSMSQIVVAPCQPVNAYSDLFTESILLARKYGVKLHTHLGEGENELMLARYGKRTLAWCEEIGFVGEDVWIAHGWELTPEEYLVMGKTGTGVSHCPGPAVLGGYPILDIQAMQKAGMLISLGCDGSATNDSSSLLDSLRVAYLMQTYFAKPRGGCVTPYEMLKIATINGAKTLGRSDLGSLEVGKAADLFMIDTGVLEMTGTLHDPKNVLARTGVTGPVWLTMVNGKVVWQNGQLTGVDERSLAAKGEEVCTRDLRAKCDVFK